jgi:crotonobetainyl-CoA:carnitine CoA-transferase CaiB-like acyl-CoA transferase
MKQALSGVQVLELGHYVAGPFSGTILGDLGADVVKVEPLSGDPLRVGSVASFVGSNRGKRSIAVDLKTEGGARVISSACEWADVVTHNFRPGVAQRLGIDTAVLWDKKPELVILESNAYGSRGPKAHLPGFDTIMQGYTGHFVQAGGEGNSPLAYRFSHVDHATGMLGALGVVASLYQRRRSGTGTLVSGDLLSTAIFMMSELVQDDAGEFHGPSTLNPERSGYHPAECLYEANDGWLAIVALDETGARRLTSQFGLDFASPRAAWGDREHHLLAAAIVENSVEFNLKAVRGCGVWAERCEDDGIKTLTEDPAMLAAGMAIVSDDPDDGPGAYVGRAATYARMPPTRAAGRTRVPSIGEHTREFLVELGYSSNEIEQMFDEGCVK